MSVKFTKNAYSTPKNILANPTDYSAFEYTHAKATAVAPGNAVLVEGRYIVKAGTIYPANDATAIGIILNDYDVTDGDAVMAVAVRADVLLAKIPAVPASAAKSALKGIYFLPFSVVPTWNNITVLAYAVGATAAGTKTITLSFKEGISFRDDAETLTNWTFTDETKVKATVTKVELSEDKKTATLTITTTVTALVAGDITAIPDASVISIGVAPAAAITVATVAVA